MKTHSPSVSLFDEEGSDNFLTRMDSS